jgi:hypothetical protein
VADVAGDMHYDVVYETVVLCRPMTFLSIYGGVVLVNTRAAREYGGGLCIPKD